MEDICLFYNLSILNECSDNYMQADTAQPKKKYCLLPNLSNPIAFFLDKKRPRAILVSVKDSQMVAFSL